MKCKFCATEYKDILRHLKTSIDCQSVYDIEAMKKERVEARQKKKKVDNKNHYDKHKNKILKDKSNYYTENKETIREKQAVSYRKYRSKVCQRKRFRKHFTVEHAMAYITEQQEHLYHHTTGICQPETMPYLNHSIEFDNGLCYYCNGNTCIKIIGVNRLVCLGCKKAHCSICKAKVSPDPSYGYRHFSPDSGYLLGFLPGYCPLYSLFPNDLRSRNSRNLKQCRICEDIKSEYPEYKLFHGKDPFRSSQNCEQIYICNLCSTTKVFVCQFDLHMRNHTKYGQNIAILGLKADMEVRPSLSRHVIANEDNFLAIESELMKISGVMAVLSVFQKEILENKNLIEKNSASFNLGAAIILCSGTDIRYEILKTENVLDKCEVLTVQNHFRETYYGSHKSFEESFLCTEKEWRYGLCRRNSNILENRCTLTYPENIYKSTKEQNHHNPYWVMSNHHCYLQFTIYESEVLQYLWKLVKDSNSCCCISRFFCKSSLDLDKCKVGCCGKCQFEKQPTSDSESENNSSSETYSETTSKSESESENEEDDFFKNLSS